MNVILASGAPMVLIWGPAYHFIYNDHYAQILQDKHPLALGSPGLKIFPELWQYLGTLFGRAYGGESIVDEDLELVLTRQGETRPGFFSFSYTPIPNEKDQVEGFLAVVLETTARVVAERAKAKVFDTVLSAINDFAYTFDTQGRFTYVNKALLDLWGLKLEDAVGKDFFDLKYPDDLAKRLQLQIQLVISSKLKVRDETRYVSPTGVVGFYEYIFSPVFAEDGSVLLVAGSTRDITSRKKLEMESAAAAKAKDDFLAALSHELRTPLNPVLLIATDAATNLDLPDDVRADFKTIADSVHLETRLIDDLLDISRITHNKFTLDLRPQDAHSLLASALLSVEAEFSEKKLVIVRHFNASTSRVIGDDARLQQIFWNLLRNAAKFSQPGGTVTISTQVAPDRPLLVVEIADQGIGLTPEELPDVFNPFQQGDHASAGGKRYGGLGLGLAISSRIVELHSGSISARSGGRDQGATFKVELPLDTSGSPASPNQSSSGHPAKPPATAISRVLLVEDHEPSRNALSRLLMARKFEVVHAASGAEALEKAKQSKFDLVISDLGLPDTDGHRLMSTLKSEYGYRGIAISGYGTLNDISSSREAGFSVHLTKPIDAKALDDALTRMSAG